MASHWPSRRIWTLLLLGAMLSGCGADGFLVMMKVDFAANGTTPASPTRLSASAGNFYHNGFPTDYRRNTRGQIDLSDFPRRSHALTNAYAQLISTDTPMAGFHPILPVYLPFTAMLDTAALPTDPVAYTRQSAPVQVVDIDPDSPEYGRRFPLSVSMTRTPDSYRPQFLLQLLPTLGVSLLPNTTYAAVVLDSMPTLTGSTLIQAPELWAVLNQDRASGATPQRAFDTFAPLRQFLQRYNVNPDIIRAATVWTTGDPGQRLRGGAEAARAAAFEAPLWLNQVQDFPDYCVIEGRFNLPQYQNGVAPFWTDGGQIEFDAANVPIINNYRKADFIVTLPKNSPMPSGGYPILHFHHGAGGQASQTYKRGGSGIYVNDDGGNGPSRVAALHGWASSGVSGHLSRGHIGELGGYGLLYYDLEQQVVMRNNYFQMAWERVFFRRWLEQLTLPTRYCPDADAGAADSFRFDPDQQVLMGQSLGSWTAALQLVADPEPFEGVVLAGVAGSWISLFGTPDFKTTDNAALAAALLEGESFDPWHPFLALVEWALGEVDPIGQFERVLRQPRQTAPHILAFSGLNDQTASESIQRQYFMALGLDLAGPEVGTAADTQLAPWLALSGGQRLDYPVQGNRDLPLTASAGANASMQRPHTAVVMRYENTVAASANGHFIITDLEAPKHQYGCLLSYLSSAITPIVGEGSAWDAACW